MTLIEFVELYGNERDVLALKKLRHQPMSLQEQLRLEELNQMLIPLFDDSSTKAQIEILEEFLAGKN